MQLLEQRIARDGFVKDHEVLMVGSFLNHQIDAAFVDKLAEELHRRFEEQPITKVLTIEASGIAIAYATALRFGVPMVFAKKTQSATLPTRCIRHLSGRLRAVANSMPSCRSGF